MFFSKFRMNTALTVLVTANLISIIPANTQTIIIENEDVIVPSGSYPSPWTIPSALVVGDSGSATLTIENGAVVSVGNALIVAQEAASSGIVTVSGNGSSLHTSDTQTIGGKGGGRLDILNGGQVTSDASVYVGGNLISKALSPAYANVDGVNSLWESGGHVIVGVMGTGTLNVTNGGVVKSGLSSYLGFNDGTSGTVNVTGSGSSFNSGAELFVGYSDGSTANLVVSDGGHVSSTRGYIGYYEGAKGTVRLTDAGTRWDVNGSDGSLWSGAQGNGTLIVENGAQVTATSYGVIGYLTTGQGLYHITGNNSSLRTDGDLYVGYFGIGVARVEDGAVLETGRHVNIGMGTTGQGTAVISGLGSQWNITGTMNIGAAGSGTLIATEGGYISAGRVTIARDSTATGHLIIGAEEGQAAVAPGNLDTATVAFGNGNGDIVFNHTDLTGNYVFAPAVSGTGKVASYAGITEFHGQSTYSGATVIHGGTLKAGVVNAFSASSDYTVNAAGTLDLNNFSQDVLSLSNAGTVSFGNLPGTILQTENYTGNGSTLILSTILGNDQSLSDKLVINGGRADGSSFVTIINAGGLGAQTVADGIMIIEAINGATTAANAFSLSGRVAAGAFEYSLYQGGNIAAGGNSNDQNWYLRSTIQVVDTDGRPLVTDSGSTTATVIEVPNYRPEVAMVASFAPLALEYGYALLDTLHERIGETYQRPLKSVTKDYYITDQLGRRQSVKVMPQIEDNTEAWFGGAWARLIGNRGLHQPDNFMRRGPNFDYTFAALQVGIDVYAREQSDGTLDKTGIYVAYGQITSNVKGQTGGKAGKVDMDAYTVGGYWTHFSPQGWYTDAVVQGTWYSTDARSVYGQKIKPDGFGILASLEGGYSYKLSNGWVIEPQAQIAYQNISFDKMVDAYGRFSISDTESLRGRLGVRLARSWALEDKENPRKIMTWLRANIWHEFMGDSTTTAYNSNYIYSAAIPSSLGGTWGEIGAGISGQITENIGLFGTASYNRSLDNKGREAWDGRLGATIRW
ncbi:autotransporter outer membrane beta-barrel domain-containing protein [Microvirga sp. W0021]|uniref:Autotransporter outer membrane beta-barrel domain-containing protein n=1 Tax=Hohaiivirga grylli TaxID=3133970 RepID=A0ABV0BN07_9HYPH